MSKDPTKDTGIRTPENPLDIPERRTVKKVIERVQNAVKSWRTRRRGDGEHRERHAK